MKTHRKLLILAVLLAVLGAGGYFLFHRYSGPPRIVQLLPEGDRLAYVNLKLVRPFWDLSKSKPLELEGNYQEFVDQTGIQFERDLDEAVFSWQDTTDGSDVESAAIFVAHFDAARLRSYLQNVSSRTETYRGSVIYSIFNRDHWDRVCVLDGTRVATTKSSLDAMRGIIDRTHEPSRGPGLLQTYYRNVPSDSVAWVIGRISAKSDAPQIGGLTFGFLENTVTVGSARYDGSLLLRAEVFAATETEARRVVDSANSFLALSRDLSRNMGSKGGDADVKAAFDSIRIEQKGNTAVFTAVLPQGFLKKVLTEAGSGRPTTTPSLFNVADF